MASRRGFITCAICSAVGLIATGVEPAQAQGVQRKTLSTIDYPGDGKISILMTLEAPAETVIARHTHPGIESTVVMEGELELEVQGQPSKRFTAGEGFQVPPGAVHGGKTLKPCRLAITYVVEKDKPLATPA
ncbi:cupin domain-containing protein [Paracraurococcus lichenis]|uniref:Cupin domain-containing protein n=1 Tax=Paracraurococcus lichenis TaxID=3064888 RepID=A0ABT9E475_9PROT|nr:cupin domain-containing protein [Paracraurococcus sp. LOR1-02]MDO9710980.1 cupin domain-containing protein [Paracraurococcus sp. LOR1-02]